MPTREILNPLMLKEGATDNLYQSTFLPLFQKAETNIKSLIASAIMLGWPLIDLRIKILAIIKAVVVKIPRDLRDRNAYINGLVKKSDIYINRYYLPMVSKFAQVQKTVQIATQFSQEPIKVSIPKELLDISKTKTETRDLWAYQKGSPNVSWYERELKKAMERLAEDPTTTYEPDRKSVV